MSSVRMFHYKLLKNCHQLMAVVAAKYEAAQPCLHITLLYYECNAPPPPFREASACAAYIFSHQVYSSGAPQVLYMYPLPEVERVSG